MNLIETLRASAARRGDAPACLGPGDAVLSYRALVAAVDADAEALARAGVHAGACVAVLVPSSVRTITVTYALWSLGACVVPIGAELPRAECVRILRTLRIDALIAAPATLAVLVRAPADQGAAQAEGVSAAGAPRPLDGGLSLLPLTPAREHPAGFAALDPAFVRFTSGTTGAAKGVVLSHGAIRERIAAANAFLQVGPDDRVLWLLSMAYHFTVSIVSYLAEGAAIVLCRNHLGATIAAAGARHGVSLIYGAPTHFEFLLGAAERLPRLRLALATTAALRPAASVAFQERFGIGLGQAYGIIEVGLPCISTACHGPLAGTVGRPLPAYQLGWHPADAGPGPRRLRIRGPGMFDAYYDPWIPRARALDDGWFDTGDLATIDADGAVRLTGRASEVINVGGMKSFPQEIEAVLEADPAVAAACVFRSAHPRLGEVPCAHLVLRPEAATDQALILQRVREACTRHLAAYQVPERIVVVPALLTTPSGKRIRDPVRLAQRSGAVHG